MNQNRIFWLRYGLFCLGIEFTLGDSPSKSIWRGKMSKGNMRFPAKTYLVGLNVNGQYEIPRQNPFRGESRYQTTNKMLPLY
ncbi:Hypothetical protein Tcol_2834 [Trichococcus collinsii]|uniref:Uncharacterized protein n=1 Tax=Trichococcus collinsii TaxID=157076 RepID=A0AB37ZYB8_9LACT|nr:Hypothetical protein Tcol_2834 [Trichococcus collinsii]SEA17679.1 hypothetical protein SAMN04488525_102167 [Trichococcus collinsii]